MLLLVLDEDVDSTGGNWLLLLLLLLLIAAVVRICEGNTVELVGVLRLSVGVKLMEDDADLTVPLLLLFVDVSTVVVVVVDFCCCSVNDDLMVLPRLQGAAVVVSDGTAVDLVVAPLTDTSVVADDVLVVVVVGGCCCCPIGLLSWKTDVDRTVWPESSPDRTNPLVDEVVVICCCCVILLVVAPLLLPLPLPPVGRVTLDVCIMGDGSTSIDSLRGIDDEEEPVPPTLTSWTLLYWMVL